MKKLFLLPFMLCVFFTNAQQVKTTTVPEAVKTSFEKKYPDAHKVNWEKEDSNYEASWGGKTKEDHSVQYTASGDFVEYSQRIPADQLPKSIRDYIKAHCNPSKITEACKITDATCKTFYEVEINKKGLRFNENGTVQ